MAADDTIGVLIGRFQVNEVHEGHVRLIDAVRRAHSRLVILLGVPPRLPNEENPLTYPIRERMMRSLVPDAVVMPILDCRTDEEWSRNVDRTIETAYPVAKAVIYGSRKSCIPRYHGRFPTKELDLGVEELSGTEVRRRLKVEIRDSPDFRAGVIHAMQILPPRINPTVDIAVLRRGSDGRVKDLLLARKAGETYRFVGGHVDRSDDDFETAARRELGEETGLSIEGDLTYVGSFMVPDWRGSDLTVLFAGEHSFGAPVARDDIAEVEWAPIGPKTEAKIVEEHLALYRAVARLVERMNESQPAVRREGEHVEPVRARRQKSAAAHR